MPERFPEQLHVWSLQRAVGLPHETLAGTFAFPQVALAAGVAVGRGVGVGAGASVVVVVGGGRVVVVVGGAAATGGLFTVGDPPPPPQEPSSRDRTTAADLFMGNLPAAADRAREALL